MFLFAFESVSPVHIALQITAEDVLERTRATDLLRSDQWQLCPLSKNAVGYPVGVSIDASTVLFRVLGKLTQIGFVAAALDDPVVLTSEYFAPEADTFDLVLSRQSFYNFVEMVSIGLAYSYACQLQNLLLLEHIRPLKNSATVSSSNFSRNLLDAPDIGQVLVLFVGFGC